VNPALHYGDPFGEQRALEAALAAGETPCRIGQWAHDAIRIAAGQPGPADTAAADEHIVFLHLDGTDNVLPLSGDGVYTGETKLGRITSAANHHELGPIAFAAITSMPDAVAGPLTVHTLENGCAYQIAASVAAG